MSYVPRPDTLTLTVRGVRAWRLRLECQQASDLSRTLRRVRETLTLDFGRTPHDDEVIDVIIASLTTELGL